MSDQDSPDTGSDKTASTPGTGTQGSVKLVSVDLPAEIFDVQVNIPLIHQVVVAQQAAARQGTADTKDAARSAAVAPSRTHRRGPVVLARARSARLSSPVVALCTARPLAATTSGHRRG